MAQPRSQRLDRSRINDTKYFVLGALLLLLLGFLMSLIKVFGHTITVGSESTSYSFHLHEVHGVWLLVISNVLHVVAIAMLLHHMFGFIRSPQIYLCICGICGFIALLLIIKWIAGFRDGDFHMSMHLTFGGWLMLISELGAAGLSCFCYLKERRA